MGKKKSDGRFNGWTEQHLLGADGVLRLLATSVRIRGAALQLIEQIHNEVCEEYDKITKAK